MSIKSGVRVFFHGLLVLVAFIVSSCTSDGLTEETAGQEATATLRLTFKLADDAVTRALSDNENTVNNVMILIFDSNEQLIGSKYVYGFSTTTSTTATVTTRVAAGCTVYAIANTGSASYFSGINTIENLNAKSTSIIGAAALGEGTNTIMAGSTPVNITAGTNSIDVPIKHLCSKLNFSIVPSSGITITGYRLCNAALGSYIIGSHTSTPPVNSFGNSYGNFDAVTLSSPTAGTTVTPPVYYVYENLAGSNSNCTTEQLRTEANAPAHAMYLEVYAKTSSKISVKILPSAVETICALETFGRENAGPWERTPYLLAILSGKNSRGSRAEYVEYGSALRRFNSHLRALAVKVDLKGNVSSYTLRHSWATAAKRTGASIEKISESLGHRSIRTTQIYLAGFEASELAEVNRKACLYAVKRERKESVTSQVTERDP